MQRLLLQITLRDIFWLTLVAGLSVGWLMDHWRMDAYLRPVPGYSRLEEIQIENRELREESQMLRTQVRQLDAERANLEKALEEK